MSVWGIIALVFGAGCIGGLVNSVLAGELQLPRLDVVAGVYRPGWVGTVLVGGVTAVVFWGLYGPMASTELFSAGQPTGAPAVLRVSELFGALLSGVGGGRLLTSEIEKKLLARKTEALDRSKSELVSAMKDLTREP